MTTVCKISNLCVDHGGSKENLPEKSHVESTSIDLIYVEVRTVYLLIKFLLETSFILTMFVDECESHTSENGFLSESCGGVISGTEIA